MKTLILAVILASVTNTVVSQEVTTDEKKNDQYTPLEEISESIEYPSFASETGLPVVQGFAFIPPETDQSFAPLPIVSTQILNRKSESEDETTRPGLLKSIGQRTSRALSLTTHLATLTLGLMLGLIIPKLVSVFGSLVSRWAQSLQSPKDLLQELELIRSIASDLRNKGSQGEQSSQTVEESSGQSSDTSQRTRKQ